MRKLATILLLTGVLVFAATALVESCPCQTDEQCIDCPEACDRRCEDCLCFRPYTATASTASRCEDGKCDGAVVDRKQVKSACLVKSNGVAGSGILVATGDNYGVVWSCHHGLSKNAAVELTWPATKETHTGSLLVADEDSDMALIYIKKRPKAPWAKIAEVMPAEGETIYYAGYGGAANRWEIRQGRFIRQVPKARLKASRVVGTVDILVGGMEWSGGSRPGDSGGPVWNEEGRLYGIIVATNDEVTIGSGVDRLYELTQTGRYILPWNADLARQEMNLREATAPQTSAPQLVQQVQDPSIVPTLQRIELKLDAGMNEIQTAFGRVPDDMAVAQAVEAGTGDLVNKVAVATEGGVKATVTTAVKGLLSKLGWGGGILGTGVAGVIVFFLLKIGKQQAMVIAQAVDKITDIIPGQLDDKLLDPLAYKFAEKVSGKQRPTNWDEEWVTVPKAAVIPQPVQPQMPVPLPSFPVQPVPVQPPLSVQQPPAPQPIIIQQPVPVAPAPVAPAPPAPAPAPPTA